MSLKGYFFDIVWYIWVYGWLVYCFFFILDIVIIGVRIFGLGVSRGGWSWGVNYIYLDNNGYVER